MKNSVLHHRILFLDSVERDWLYFQEAEQRRINEKNQRSVGRKPQQHVTGTSVPYAGSSSARPDGKPLPDSIIQTLTQRIQNRVQERPPPPRRRYSNIFVGLVRESTGSRASVLVESFYSRLEQSTSHEHLSSIHQQTPQHVAMVQHPKVHQYSAGNNADTQEKMLSVSGKKKCSHCGDELGTLQPQNNVDSLWVPQNFTAWRR